MTQDMFALEANLPTSLLPSTLKYKNFLKSVAQFFLALLYNWNDVIILYSFSKIKKY